jgi:hypothetical protein
MPAPPASKPRWLQKVKAINEKIILSKSWTEGLQDSIIAADVITGLDLQQKNRIAFIILDSTLEIAYKEYLAKERRMGVKKFKEIVENRSSVQEEVFKYIDVDDDTKGKLHHYYILRNDLIHSRATPNILDTQVVEYRQIVERLLSDMFGLNFDV